MGETGEIREPEHAAGVVVGLADAAPAGALALKLGGDGVEAVLGVPQEQEPEDRDGVLGGLETAVRPQLIRRGPEAVFDLGDVREHVLPLESRSPSLGAAEPTLTRGRSRIKPTAAAASSTVSLDLSPTGGHSRCGREPTWRSPDVEAGGGERGTP